MSSASLGTGLALAWRVQKQLGRIFFPSSEHEGDTQINALMVNLDTSLPPLYGSSRTAAASHHRQPCIFADEKHIKKASRIFIGDEILDVALWP